MLVSKEVMQGLNTLLARSRDAEKGYIEVSNHINEPRLRKWLLEYSDQHKQFSAELASEIRALAGDPDDGTSILGELHRAWIDLKGTASDNEPIAMLEECERGEQQAYDDYQELLNDHTDMLASTRALLQQQRIKIGTALEQVKSMKKVFEPIDSSFRN